jgi:hypothetical protein
MLERLITIVDGQADELKKEYFALILRQCNNIIDTVRTLTKVNLETEQSQKLHMTAQDFRSKLNTALITRPGASDPEALLRQIQPLKNSARALIDSSLQTLRTEYQDADSDIFKINGMANESSLSRDKSRSDRAYAARKLSESDKLSAEEKALLVDFSAKSVPIMTLDANREAMENCDVRLKIDLTRINEMKIKQLTIKELRQWADDRKAPENSAATKIIKIIFETNKFPKKMEEQIIALQTSHENLTKLFHKFTQVVGTSNMQEYNEINFNLEKVKSHIINIQLSSMQLLKKVMAKSFIKDIMSGVTPNISKDVKERDEKISAALQKGSAELTVLEAYVKKYNLAPVPTKEETGAKKSFADQVTDYFSKRKARIQPFSNETATNPLKDNFVEEEKAPRKRR